jgi:ATP/maltotriose-dependent transcriptional regulator MalT
MRLAQCRCVIHAIAGHRNELAILNQLFNNLLFLMRLDACKYTSTFYQIM